MSMPSCFWFCWCVATSSLFALTALATPTEPYDMGGAQFCGEARLTEASCAETEREQNRVVARELTRMHAAIDETYRVWQSELPKCPKRKPRRTALERLWGHEDAEDADFGEAVSDRRYVVGEGATVVSDDECFGSEHRGVFGMPDARDAAFGTSATNVQVAGVDRPDILKTDGNYVFFAANGSLRIARSTEPQLLSSTPLGGAVIALFVKDSLVVAYVRTGSSNQRQRQSSTGCESRDGATRTDVVLLNVEVPSAPRVLRRISLSGALVAARRIGDTVHTVTSEHPDSKISLSLWPNGLSTCVTDEALVKSSLSRLAADNEAKIRGFYRLPSVEVNGQARTFCPKVFRSNVDSARAYTTLFSFNIKDELGEVSGITLRSLPEIVFTGTESLYLVAGNSDPRELMAWESSVLHAFRIGDRPEASAYVDSAMIAGRVSSQFALDEYQGVLRVATTAIHDGSWRDTENRLLTLRQLYGQLVHVGEVGQFSPHERIRGVRFAGERAYVVTFKETDPFFVLDLSSPRKPRVLGELPVAGYSTYIHQVTRNHLLTIGIAGSTQGERFRYEGFQLQLFDVTDGTAPKLLFLEDFEASGASSAALRNHLAFNFLPHAGLLAIPVAQCEATPGEDEAQRLTFDGLLVYDVSVESGFHLRARVPHDLGRARCELWFRRSSKVMRSLFLNGHVWSMTSDEVIVKSLSNPESATVNISLK